MLIRQKAGWRLHHQAYLWPKRYKPFSSLSSSSTTDSSLPIKKSSLPSASSSRKRTVSKLACSTTKKQQRKTEVAAQRQTRAKPFSRRISSNGSDGVPSPTSPSSSSSSSSSSTSSSSPRKLSRGHLDPPWFLGAGPYLLKPWEEPFLDFSEDEEDETIAVRLRRHTRKRCSSNSSSQEHESLSMTASTAAPHSSSDVMVDLPGADSNGVSGVTVEGGGDESHHLKNSSNGSDPDFDAEKNAALR
ncbi:hypothetical protein PoB_007509600 [Plakobranchus ocellatus]|uniref:Uncharacterized protein n=1 Tax=Plakobranchus ocellatus TaxID=259542 RepID=A0AAV4DWW1_9GAST|nr:hypothetical protein PoB_007509600 [Plakobranchus ocellatus]